MEVSVVSDVLERAGDRGVQVGLAPRERCVTLPPGLPELSLGFGALAWMREELRVPSGPFAGRPFECSLDQALFLVWFYAVRGDGSWVFRRGTRQLAKGSGKSPFAAALCLFELLGPARFGGLDDGLPGGCFGVPVRLPLVQLAATSMSQTGVTMRVLRGMANKRTELARKYDLDCGKTYIDTPDGGKVQLLTSSAASAEGFESSFIIADETEHWTPSSGGVDMWHTLRRNAAKTGTRMVETCNSWIPGRDSVAELSFEDWCDQEEGRLVSGAGRSLYDARVAPACTVLSDDPGPGEVSLSDGLRFVYDTMPWVDVGAIREEIWSPSMPASVSRRFYLNQPTVAEDAWVSLQEWASLADTSRELVDGEDVVLFFDGSKTGDHTALVGCCVSDGFVFTVGVWEPGGVSGEVDSFAVDAAVRSVFERFAVRAFWADVREWESFVKVSWPSEFGEGLVIPAQAYGKAAAKIAWDMRSHGFDFAVATEMCHAEIEDALFKHDGNWVTSRHVGNCRMVERRGHVTVRKESPKSPNKIDAAVCVIGARMVYRALLASPEWERLQNRGKDWVVF